MEDWIIVIFAIIGLYFIALVLMIVKYYVMEAK